VEIPLQITLRDIRRSEALYQRIRNDADRLERLHPEIMSCRVVVEEADRHRRQGREFNVHVECRVPGQEAKVSTMRRDGDVYVALRDAFEAVHRQFG
jgi:ribosome-associated translation inhibitor RaiA